MKRPDEVCIDALVTARAAAGGVTVEARAIGSARVLLCEQSPADVGYNRAFHVDAREPGVAADVTRTLQASGRRAVLEVDVASLDETSRATLAALGLTRRWELATVARDLDALPPPRSGEVRVREVGPGDADAFGDLAVRAYGEPPPGFPAIDPAREAAKWSAFVRHGRARCFVAEVNEAPCAMAMFLRVGDAALVDGAATLATHRGLGCHSALLAARFVAAAAEGATHAFTRAANPRSLRNLARAGMRTVALHEVWMDG